MVGVLNIKVGVGRHIEGANTVNTAGIAGFHAEKAAININFISRTKATIVVVIEPNICDNNIGVENKTKEFANGNIIITAG